MFASLIQEVKNIYLMHAMKSYSGSLGIAPFTFNPGLHFTPVPYE
jgi:hypothetical protein